MKCQVTMRIGQLQWCFFIGVFRVWITLKWKENTFAFLLLIKGLANLPKCYDRKTNYELQPFLELHTVTSVSSRSGWISKLKYELLWPLIKNASFTFFISPKNIYQQKITKFWYSKQVLRTKYQLNISKFKNTISLGEKSYFYHFLIAMIFKVLSFSLSVHSTSWLYQILPKSVRLNQHFK